MNIQKNGRGKEVISLRTFKKVLGKEMEADSLTEYIFILCCITKIKKHENMSRLGSSSFWMSLVYLEYNLVVYNINNFAGQQCLPAKLSSLKLIKFTSTIKATPPFF